MSVLALAAVLVLFIVFFSVALIYVKLDIDTLDRSRKIINVRLDQQTEFYSDQVGDYIKLKNEFASFVEQLNELKEVQLVNIQIANQNIHNLQEFTRASLHQLNEEIQAQNKVLDQMEEDYKDEVVRLKVDFAHLESETNESLNNVSNALSHGYKKINDVDKSLHATQKLHNSLMLSVSDLEREQQKYTKAFDNIVEKTGVDVMNTVPNIRSLYSQISSAVGAIYSLTNNLEIIKRNTPTLQECRDITEAAVNKVKLSVSSLDFKVSELNKMKEDTAKEATLLKQEAALLKHAEDTLLTEYENQQKTLTNLAEEFKALKEKFEDVDKKSTLLYASDVVRIEKVNTLSDKLDKVQKYVLGLNDATKEIIVSGEKYFAKQIKDLEEKIKKHDAELAEYNNETHLFSANRQAINATLNNVKKDMEALRNNIAEVDESRQRDMSVLNGMEATLDNKINAIQVKVDKVYNAIDKW